MNLDSILQFLKENINDLTTRLAKVAEKNGYFAYTPTSMVSWKMYVKGILLSLEKFSENKSPAEIKPDADYPSNPFEEFLQTEVLIHRRRGLSLEMFLGLFKHFKIEIMHMLKENGFNEKEIWPFLLTFEKGEITIINCWRDKKLDVEDSKHFEEIRKFSEDKNKYLEILNSFSFPIVFFDDSAKPKLVNNYAEELFGTLDSRNTIVYSYDNFLLPEWVSKLAVKFMNEEYKEKKEKVVYGNNTFHVGMKKIYDAKGDFKGISAIFSDISDLEHTKNEAEKYRYILENSLNEIYIFNRNNFKFVDVNRGARLNLGYSLNELKQMTPVDIMVDFKSMGDFRKQINRLTTGEVEYLVLEATHRRKDGSTYIAEAHVQKMGINGEILFVAIVSDVTKTKSIEKELRELNQNLETRVQEEMHKRLQNEKALLEQKKFADMGQLISAIGHQWRQPLNALGLYVQSIRFWYEHGELTEENIREFERESMELIHSMSSTIDEFRNYFATNEKPKTFDAIDVLLNVINIMSSEMAARNIRYSLKCHCSWKKTQFDYEDGCINGCEKGVALVYGYKDKFRQCLINLITNSIEAIVANNVQKGNIKIEVDAMNPENLIIFIDDNGGGVPQSIANNIFDPYFTTKHEGLGTGLGLSFVKNIIDKHMGGQINFRNTYEGVTFILTLPKKKVNANA